MTGPLDRYTSRSS